MAQFLAAHWVQIVAAASTTYAAVVELFSRISAALPAPTATSTSRYIFWFKFANNLARNPERSNNTSIESSPNFIPAAEAYMQRKLSEAGMDKAK